MWSRCSLVLTDCVDVKSRGRSKLLTGSVVYLFILLFIPSTLHEPLAFVSFHSADYDWLETLRKWLGNSGCWIVIEFGFDDEFFIWDKDIKHKQGRAWCKGLWVSIKRVLFRKRQSVLTVNLLHHFPFHLLLCERLYNRWLITSNSVRMEFWQFAS